MASVGRNLMKNVNFWKILLIRTSQQVYNKYQTHKKIMKYALCVKLCQQNFTIVIVHKLLVHGHCLESGLHSLPSRSSRCPRLNTLMRIKKMCMAIEGYPIVPPHSVRKKCYNQDFFEIIEAKRGQWSKILGLHSATKILELHFLKISNFVLI